MRYVGLLVILVGCGEAATVGAGDTAAVDVAADTVDSAAPVDGEQADGEQADGADTASDGAGAADAADTASTPDATSPDAAPPPPQTVEDAFCRPLAELLCAAAADCNCHDPFATPPGPPDVPSCVEAETARCLEQLAPIQAAMDAGQLQVAAGRVQTCLDGLSASLAPCEAPGALVTQLWCRTLFSSDAPFGEACQGDVCADGAGACDGTCSPLPVEGEACGGICAPGLLCSPAGKCATPLSAGTPCSPEGMPCAPPTHCIDGGCRVLGGPGESCTTEGGCRPGLVCGGGTCSEGPTTCEPGDPCGNEALCFGRPERHCAAPLPDGVPCTQDDSCEGWCDGTCAPLPTSGEPCANGTLCAPGLGCGMDFGTCGPLPGLGEPCAFGLMGPTLCEGELGCVEGLCAPLPGLDEPCTTDSRCDGGDLDGDGLSGDLGCDFQATGSFCVERRGVGGECQTDLTCKPGLFCDYTVGQCAAAYAPGTPCKHGNECGLQGSCIPDEVGDFSCKPLGTAVGDGCFFDCGAGLWCAMSLLDGACAPKACLVLAP